MFCVTSATVARTRARRYTFTMADKEKRRSAAIPSGMSAGKAIKPDSDVEFLSQAGVGDLLRGALLKMVEARSDDPIGFLADHFCNLASVTDSSPAGCGEDEQMNGAGACAQEQQHLNRALWHLRLAHHSQRSELLLLHKTNNGSDLEFKCAAIGLS